MTPVRNHTIIEMITRISNAGSLLSMETRNRVYIAQLSVEVDTAFGNFVLLAAVHAW